MTPPSVSKAAVRKARQFVVEARPAFQALSGDEVGDAELVERAEAHLAGQADPAGAAAVALLVDRDRYRRLREDAPVLRTFTDAWVVEHGLEFTARAVVELGAIETQRKVGGSGAGDRLGFVRGDYKMWGETQAHKCARKVRTLLAAAENYEQVADGLAELRDAPGRRAAVSYLVPTRHDWVTECCAEATEEHRERRYALLLTIGGVDHVTALGGPAALVPWDCTMEVLVTLVDALGADALPMFGRSLVHPLLDRAAQKHLVEVIGVLPTDEAFQVLMDRFEWRYVQPGLLAMMNRFPARALRMMSGEVAALRARGEARAADALSELLAGHLASHPDLVAAVEPELSGEHRAVIAGILGTSERVPDAPTDALPPLLVEPPWTRKRKPAEPVVIEGLKVPDERGMVWADGERERWSVRVLPQWGRRLPPDPDWEGLSTAYRSGKMHDSREVAHFLAGGPEEYVRPVLGLWEGFRYWDNDEVPWMRSVVGRYGLNALPLALKAARANPGACAKLLLPFLDAQVATSMAEWLARVKSARAAAISWFERHGARGAALLIPAALGKAGKARREAEGALLLIASRIGDEPVVDAAREHGDRAAGAIAALLSTDPLDRLPAKMPKDADWADPGRLPQVLLRGGERALPPSAVRHLVTMLAMSKPGEVYAGVDVVRDVCDTESLAEFSWGLFEQWERAGAPSKDGWALNQLAWLGDDETVRRLAPMIRAWPGQSAHKKAVNGLDVLAEIGSDVALLHLNGIATKVKFKGLRTKAEEKIAEVAATLGLSAERLADRLVPDFGLDADGGMTLDYGPRRFTVWFDEQLRPFVMDEDGKLRKALPKPGAKDDPELAPAAYKRFAGLKKDVRTVASDQIRRLETAMVTRRRWTPEEFRGLFVEHPLVWHIARRLVWLAETESETESHDGTTTFRIAEDRTLADAADQGLHLPGGASVGIAHTLDLSDRLTAWSEVFDDYEILQPFPQLAREVHALTPQERASGRLTRFEGIKVPTTRVLGLVRRGWERGMPLDAGIERWISKPVPGSLHVVIDLEHGINAGFAHSTADQTLSVVWINDEPQDFHPSTNLEHTFGELDPITASELLADFAWLTESAL